MKKKYIIILCVLLALAVAATCLFFLLSEKEEGNGRTRKDYNVAVTNYALRRNFISTNEILLADVSTDGKDGNIIMTFHIYTVADGYAPSYFMDMEIAEAKENPGLSRVGFASASFLNGDPNQVFGLNVSHNM